MTSPSSQIPSLRRYGHRRGWQRKIVSLAKLTEAMTSATSAQRAISRGFFGSLRCTPFDFIVIFVARFDQSATKVCFEIGDGILLKHDEVSAKRSYGQDGEVSVFSLRYWPAQRYYVCLLQ